MKREPRDALLDADGIGGFAFLIDSTSLCDGMENLSVTPSPKSHCNQPLKSQRVDAGQRLLLWRHGVSI